MQQFVERIRIMLRVRKHLKVCASIRARKQGRSLNNYLESLLVKDLEPDLPPEPTEELDITFE